MMSICIKINNVFRKKYISKKSLLLFLSDDVCRWNLDLDGILWFLKEIEKNEVLSKVYWVKLILWSCVKMI